MSFALPCGRFSFASLLRRWGLRGLLFAVCLIRASAQSTSLTEEECEANGRQIAKLLAQKKTEAIMELFDFTSNFELIVEGLDLDERRKVFFRERYRTSALRSLKTTLRQCDSARYIRVDWVNGEKRILIRALDKETSSYNYLGSTLARDDFSGGIKITDLHDFLAGETISQQTRGILAALLAVQNRAIKEGLPELVQSHLDNLDLVESASDLIANRRFKEALEELKPLPESWKKLRFVLYLRYLASQHADHDECQRVAQDWTEAFPGDPSLDMVYIQTDEWLKKYDSAIRHVDALMGNVGEDGYLQLMKAELCLKNNDPEATRKCARTALEKEPDLDQARLLLVKAALRLKDHPATLALFRDFSRRFPRANLPQLIEAEPGYTDFIESEAYRKWVPQ